VALAVAGLLSLIYGLVSFRGRIAVTETRNQPLPGTRSSVTQYARSRGVQFGINETVAIRDLIPLLLAGEPYIIGFTFRFVGLAVLVLSTLLAVGTGMLAFGSDDGGGWVFIGFVVLFAGVWIYQIVTADDGSP
jgi:hypothetical protein